jgi:glycerophosphoryl diester phosphodiesterase
MVHPFAPEPDLEWLTEKPFAHRGLHTQLQGRPENSMAAFEEAIAMGHGIELDVQLTYDGDAIVFHDDTLERMTSQQGAVIDFGLSKLESLNLLGSSEKIMSLTNCLQQIAGRAPVLIEAKCPLFLDPVPLSLAVRRALEGYRGPVAVISFHPQLLAWFAANAPKVIRGLIVTDATSGVGGWLARAGLARLFSIWRARPHFLAYNVRSLPSTLSKAFRRRGLPVLTWTVRDDHDRGVAARYADNIIYEAERPNPGQ